VTSTVHDGSIARLSAEAEHRGGRAARRADGAYFTDDDVALHLARRAIGALLLEAAGRGRIEVDALLADGEDVLARTIELCRGEPARRAGVRARLERLDVLDPSCGAGSFLRAAWAVLDEVSSALGGLPLDGVRLHGIDIDEGAVDACRRALELATGRTDAGADVRVEDAERASRLPRADIVLGNPPFVRAAAVERHADLATRDVPNRSAWIVERALDAASPGARVAFVLPVSTSCADAFAPARDAWGTACSVVLTSHFDTIPASLFDGVVQRISIYEGCMRQPRDGAATAWYTTRYHRWLRDERSTLLDTVRHVPLPTPSVGGSIAKVGSRLESDLLELLFAHPPAGRWFDRAGGSGANRIRYKRRWSYYLLFTDFVPGIWDETGTPREPTELKVIDVDPALDARVLLAAYSSTLFWWYFSVFTDNRNVNRRDLAAFPLPDLDAGPAERLGELGDELMEALHACAEVRTCTYRSIGTIRNTYFRQSATRPVLDRIDRELADAFGMDESQLEFVLGFERRFRA
jgi:predicted RNA methylase